MATTPVWQGGAPAIAQVNTFTFTGTWVVGELVTFTFGGRSYSYPLTSIVIATFLPLLATALEALSGSTYPEIFEEAWTNTATTLIATANTPGKPFLVTVSTNSVAGLINGGVTTPGTATVVSSGPEDYSTAANWSLGAVPVATDNVIIDREGASIRYNLPTAGPTLGSIRCIAKKVTLGLPETNSDGSPYPEYRNTFFGAGCTSFYMNSPQCQRFKINFLAVQTLCQVDATGNGAEQNVPAFLCKGTHASNAYVFNGGSIGMGQFGSVAYTGLTVIIGASANVTMGAGGTPATVTNNGGTLTAYCPISTLLAHPTVASAKSTLWGNGAIAQITAQGGAIIDNGNGTIGGNTVLGGSAILTFDGGQGAIAVTNPILIESNQAGFSDALGRITGGVRWSAVNCIPGRLGFKPNHTGALTYL